MLAQASSNGFFELLQSLDKDPLAAIFIIGTIGSFVTLFILIGALFSTIRNITTTKMCHSMVKELLEKGYSAEETERLVYGGLPWTKKLSNLMRSATSRLRQPHPVPPVKQPV